MCPFLPTKPEPFPKIAENDVPGGVDQENKFRRKSPHTDVDTPRLNSDQPLK